MVNVKTYNKEEMILFKFCGNIFLKIWIFIVVDFGRSSWNQLVEPHFHTSAGLQKPDLVAYGPDKASVVLDACVVSDMYDDPDQPHVAKVTKYNTEEIRSQVERLTGSVPEVSSVTISWRGVFSPSSAAYLRTLGFTQADLGLLSAITVEQGAIIHRLFNTSTLRTGAPL